MPKANNKYRKLTHRQNLALAISDIRCFHLDAIKAAERAVRTDIRNWDTRRDGKYPEDAVEETFIEAFQKQMEGFYN